MTGRDPARSHERKPRAWRAYPLTPARRSPRSRRRARIRSQHGSTFDAVFVRRAR
jgi:hypothetical protein